jgi:hypothetical protein
VFRFIVFRYVGVYRCAQAINTCAQKKTSQERDAPAVFVDRHHRRLAIARPSDDGVDVRNLERQTIVRPPGQSDPTTRALGAPIPQFDQRGFSCFNVMVKLLAKMANVSTRS